MATTCPPNCIQGTPLWNIYDVTDTNPEFCFFESVIMEFADITGWKVLYYRAKSDMDQLYGEDANQDFYDPVETRLFYEPTDEPFVINQFGWKNDDTLQYSLIPKGTYTRDVGGGDEELAPIPGDVIHTLWDDRKYEIVDIGQKQSVFQGKRLVWEFILRPFRFSEESLKSEEIYRSEPDWTYIYIYPDGETADVTYPDGTEALGVPVDSLGLDLTGVDCGVKYKKNKDGSVEIFEETLVYDEEKDPHPTHTGADGTTAILEDKIPDQYGDDKIIEEESDEIDPYADVDTSIFGF